MSRPSAAASPHVSRRSVAAAAVALICLASAGRVHAAETGDLNALRDAALEQVNQSRRDHGLPPLERGTALDEAAQNHAEDMLRRSYYSHRSPEGNTPMDRYRAAGGGTASLVAENIARCTGCPLPPDKATVRELHKGWMNSPEHRDNILARGLERFGFGIAGEAGSGLYAVQTFAGPGTPDTDADRQATPIGPDDAQSLAIRLVNQSRQEKGVAPLSAAPALSEAGRQALSGRKEGSPGDGERVTGSPLRNLSREARSRWRTIFTLSATCGGCGTRPTDADVRSFVQQWLGRQDYRDQLLDPDQTDAGFALSASGDGRKAAMMMLGGR